MIGEGGDRGGGGEWGARLRNRLRQLRRVKSYGATVFAGAKTGERPVIGRRAAVQAETAHGGKGIVYAIPESRVQGRILPPQRNALPYESEVPLEVQPLDIIPNVSTQALTTSQARSLLQKAGIKVPARIRNPEDLTQLLKIRESTTPEQMRIIIKELKK